MIKVKSREQLKKIINERMKKDGNQCNLNDLDVSNITNMSRLFSDCGFNGYIDKWDVSKVKNMFSMFSGSPFNQDISKWNTKNVKDMGDMFSSSFFNQDISNWDVSNVIFMSVMFSYSPFNQNISKWDVSNVKHMYGMFLDNKSNLSEIKKSVCKWNFNPEVNLKKFMNNPVINNLEDLKNMCKREQILKRIGSFRDLLDI